MNAELVCPTPVVKPYFASTSACMDLVSPWYGLTHKENSSDAHDGVHGSHGLPQICQDLPSSRGRLCLVASDCRPAPSSALTVTLRGHLCQRWPCHLHSFGHRQPNGIRYVDALRRIGVACHLKQETLTVAAAWRRTRSCLCSWLIPSVLYPAPNGNRARTATPSPKRVLAM
jgi:hypothetical protein